MKNFISKHILSGCFVVLAALSIGCLSPSLGWAGDSKPVSASEQNVKAVYLYNFLRFVHWPADNKLLANGTSTLKKIAVVGDCPFSDALRRLEAKLAGSGRSPISITFHGPFREGMNLRDCNLLYICESEKGQVAAILQSLGDAPVLTVADGESFIAAGGMVALVHYDNTVRWSINRTPLARSGLRVSAKLFDIAINVIDDQNSFLDKNYQRLARVDWQSVKALNVWSESFGGLAPGMRVLL